MRDRLLSATVLIVIVTVTLVVDHATHTVAASMAFLALATLLSLREAGQLVRVSAGPGSHRSLVVTYVLILAPAASMFVMLLMPDGGRAALCTVAIAKMTDNGGLFIGKWFGSRKLAPRVSPAKTVEGLFGGLAAASLTAIAVCSPSLGEPGWRAAVAGLILGAFAVVGDLLASAAKRRAGVKDSGRLLPGIGGVLDLMDSIFGAAPAALALFVFSSC